MLSNFFSINWCSIQDQFLGGAESGCGRTNFCWTSWNLLIMGFPTVYESTRFSWTPILVILGLRTNFYWGRKCVGWVKFYLFLTFWNLLFIGFPTVYDSTTYNYEHPFLVIFALRTRFRLGRKLVGLVKMFLILKHILKPKKLNKWTDGLTVGHVWYYSLNQVENSCCGSLWKIAD